MSSVLSNETYSEFRTKKVEFKSLKICTKSPQPVRYLITIYYSPQIYIKHYAFDPERTFF